MEQVTNLLPQKYVMMKFELEEHHRNVSEKELITDLKRVASHLGKETITQAEYNKYGKYHSCTLRRKIGSWFEILSKAGLEKTRNYDLTKEELIEDLIRVSKKLNKNSITKIEYETLGKFSANPFIHNFGSWFKASEKAGLQKTRNLGVTAEEYFKNLEEVWIKLGRQPKYGDMQKPLSKYVAGAYEHRFGTWRKALEKFIEYINREEVPVLDKSEESVEMPVSPSKTIIKHETKRNISERLRFIIMKRDNFKCRISGHSPATDPSVTLEVDHIIPWTKGGETVPENLQTLCSKCNRGKGNLE